MSLSVDIFDHPRAGMFYVVFQHDRVYELNSFTKPNPDAHCVELGSMWPKGEHGLIGGRFGRHILWDEVPLEAKGKIMHIINSQTHQKQ